MITNELMLLSQAARQLELSNARVRQLADTGQLPSICIDGGWRAFRKADVDRLAAERAQRLRQSAPVEAA